MRLLSEPLSNRISTKFCLDCLLLLWRLWECVTASKALIHANAKRKGNNSKGWVGNQAFRLAEDEKKWSLEEISKNLLGNQKIEITFKMTITKLPS